MKLVYICAPYGAPTPIEIDANVARAVVAAHTVLAEEDCPVVPHLLFAQLGLNDTSDRPRVLEMCIELMLSCDELLVVAPRISSGMRQEINAWMHYAAAPPRVLDGETWQRLPADAAARVIYPVTHDGATVRIRVTAECIALSRIGHNPIVAAFVDAGFQRVALGRDEVHYGACGVAHLPAEAVDWLHAWESGVTLDPFAFDVVVAGGAPCSATR